MQCIFRSKKGVSPLIATILLIAFAVALASVILQWGLNLNLTKYSDICAGVEIKVRKVGNSEACFGGNGANGYINFVIDNIGANDLDGLAILIIGEKGTKLFDIDNVKIKKDSLYEKEDKKVIYDFITYGNIKQIQFIPKIKSGQTAEICSKNVIVAKNIGLCA